LSKDPSFELPLLDPAKLNDDYTTAKTAMKPYWDPFDEYERIARNRPHPKVVAAKLPTVTDGTLAGVISAQPKRVVQRIPTGNIKSVDQPELAKIADYIWENEIIPNANTNGDMIQKSWIMLGKALTYGYQFSYDFFKNSGDYFGADFSIPYVRDLIFERGKVYGPDCNKLFLRQWYTPGDIQLIIDKEAKLARRAKKRKDTYSGTWDIQKLKKLVKQAEKAKDADALTPSEKEKSPDAKLIEIVHAFQVGVGAKFYSFAPDLPDDENIVRTKVNPDPRGKMPINFLYAGIDLSNPLGRGYPEISGGMQNLLDSEVQSYQFMQKLMLAPPVMKWGSSIVSTTVKYKPNAVWDMGGDSNAKIEPVSLNTEAISNFATNYGLMKSQILALTGNQDSSVGGGSTGGAGQSKTSRGVSQQESKIGFDDNYVRKQFEGWFQDNAESMINIHFAESDGEREIELTEDYIKDVTPAAELPPQEQQDMQSTVPSMQTPDKQPTPTGPFQQTPQVTIDPLRQQATVAYGQIKSKFRFTVDPTSSEMIDDQTQVENLNTLLKEASSNPYLYYYMLSDGYQLNLGEAYRQLFNKLGVEEIDKIVTKLPDGGSASSNQLRGVMNPLYDKPKVDIKYPDLPPSGQIQAAANAGITLTEDDVTQGPVLDPNIRGVYLPQPSPDPRNPEASQPLPPNGQIELPKGAMLVPNPGDQNGLPMAQQPAQPVAPQQPASPLPATQPTDQIQTQPAAPQQPAQPQLSPADQVLAKQLLAAGYSSEQTMNAITLLNHGYSHAQIMHTLGNPQGGTA